MNWLLHSTAGTATRIVVGCCILLTLMIVDLARNRSRATRWREYLFLVICVATAIVYGVVNDQVTSRISWEYFYYGKELEKVLGPQVPPDSLALSREAAKIGAMATWSVGLILGVAILIANNPRRDRAQLSFRELLKLLLPVIGITITFAVAFGFLGWFGGLNWISEDFRDMWRADIFRPRHFSAAYGAHLGGYLGGLLAGAIAVARVIRMRRIGNAGV
jgi:membrane associated rhomboid family serine protease